MTEPRHTASTINDLALDELYARLEAAEAAVERVQVLAEEHPAGIDTALILAALDGTEQLPDGTPRCKPGPYDDCPHCPHDEQPKESTTP
ncbi:hypothetical protein ACFVAF_18120 [Streptomyces sp. NPDC057596]|uniref:hypothetical protein n=1 Tax=Streptomyces sp. NPDC057596 TaxID=3346178 RepID=UPI0036D043A1